MSDDFNYPPAATPPPAGSAPIPPLIPSSGKPPPRRRRESNPLANWALAAVIVLILAVAGGLITAWLVANSRAVPEPVGFATATPSTPPATFCAACGSPSPAPSAAPTEGPRFTPTAPATPEITPAPFTHTVEAGESLTYIAGLYQVAVQDIMDLNDIKNPNRIFIGQKLLIPGYGVHPTEKPTKPPK